MTELLPIRLEGLTGHGDLTITPGRPWLIGRGAAADLVIVDAAVSRHHAEVEATPTGLRARDLGSANGTFVNGAAIKEAILRPGDTLTVGRPAFRVAEPAGTADLDVGPWRAPPAAALGADHPDLLRRLLALATTLSGSFELDHLCETVVDLTFDVVDADRVALLVARGPGGELVPVRSRSRVGQDAAIRVPRAIAGRAAATRHPVLTDSALEDARLQSGSVESSRVRSAVAVPLLASEDQVVGVLYADRIANLDAFTDADAAAVFAFAGLAAVSVAKLEFLASLERQRDVQRNMERFFAPEVAAAIARSERVLTAGGERRTVTILFSDIRDFTPLAESLPPEEIAGLLTEYFAVMADVVFEHGGMLDKFLGDGLLAVWGTADAPDASRRAVLAAAAMREGVQHLNRAWEAAGRPTLGVGIGLARGEAFVGRIGGEHRLDYTVIGDAVNVAARLCKVARAGEILITGPVLEALPDRSGFIARSERQVRGRSGLVEVWGG